MQLGAQLYTVRDFTQNLNDLSETLKKIADIGYKTVQVSGSCDYDPEWLKAELVKNNLTCTVTHRSSEKIKSNTNEEIVAHKIFGCKNIGLGWYNFNELTPQDFYNEYKTAAKQISESGLKFMFHNHSAELKKHGNITYLEELSSLFADNELSFIIDTYWLQFAGCDPSTFIKKFKNRAECVHFKDMAYNQNMMPVGQGNMNFENILLACSDANTKYIYVEQDNCNGSDPFKCLKQSYDYLKSLGLR